MDKIQELHEPIVFATIQREIDIRNPATRQHAAITEDLMLAFQRWCIKEGWKEHSSGGFWYKLDYPSQWPTPHMAKDAELIQLFKDQL